MNPVRFKTVHVDPETARKMQRRVAKARIDRHLGNMLASLRRTGVHGVQRNYVMGEAEMIAAEALGVEPPYRDYLLKVKK